jgi:hypothetical protein
MTRVSRPLSVTAKPALKSVPPKAIQVPLR